MALVVHPTGETSAKLIGAAIEVHRNLGPGLLESAYHSCLCRELDLRGVRYISEVPLPVEYKGIHLPKAYVLDLVVENELIVEIKAVDKLLPIHSAQLLTYMKLRGMAAGLLINFNVQVLTHGIKRKLR